MRRRDTQSAHAWWRQGHGSCRHGRSPGARASQEPQGGIIPPNHTRGSRRLSLFFLLQRAPRDLRVLGSGHQSREVYMPFTLVADLARLQHYLSRSRGHSSSRVVCPRQLPLNTTRVARASNDPAPMARLCSRNRSARMPRIITGWKWSSVCGVQQNTHMNHSTRAQSPEVHVDFRTLRPRRSCVIVAMDSWMRAMRCLHTSCETWPGPRISARMVNSSCAATV